MPITEGKYQCKICEDIFEAKSGSFTKCKCGQSEIEPRYFGYSYKNGNEVIRIEEKSYHIEEEFVKLPEDIQKIYNEIKQIKDANGFKYFLHEMTDTGKDGERYLSKIHITHDEWIGNHSHERNSIELNVNLTKKDYQGDEKTRSRLQRFLNFMKAIESGELDLSKRKKMVELAEDEGIYYTEEPTGDTNVTFYI